MQLGAAETRHCLRVVVLARAQPLSVTRRHLYCTSCKYPSSGRSSTRACGARCSALSLVTRAVITVVRTEFRNRSLGVASAVVRTQFEHRSPGVAFAQRSGCFVLLSLPHAYPNDLDIDLARNTPWVDMSACVKFGLDRPSRLAGHTEHRS